jgi:hypothetical protein
VHFDELAVIVPPSTALSSVQSICKQSRSAGRRPSQLNAPAELALAILPVLQLAGMRLCLLTRIATDKRA